jgi:hypothetical protein
MKDKIFAEDGHDKTGTQVQTNKQTNTLLQ